MELFYVRVSKPFRRSTYSDYAYISRDVALKRSLDYMQDNGLFTRASVIKIGKYKKVPNNRAIHKVTTFIINHAPKLT